MEKQICVWQAGTKTMHKIGGLMGDSKEETKNNRFTKRIGATTYVVNVHFAETDSVTVEDRLLHLIRNDIRVNDLPVVAEE